MEGCYTRLQLVKKWERGTLLGIEARAGGGSERDDERRGDPLYR